MNSPEIKQFIRDQHNLFWYTPENKKEDISKEFLGGDSFELWRP